jgi:hypothetical protein
MPRFVDCEKWRAEYAGVGVEELVRTFDYKERPEVFQYYPQYYHKTDKVRLYIALSPATPIHYTPNTSPPKPLTLPQDGRPVYIEQLGNVDLTALGKITSQERMIQNLVCEYEKMADPRLPACSRKSGYLLETSCSILDLKGVGIAKATSVYGYLQAVSAISQNYYPERLGKMYVINAPWVLGCLQRREEVPRPRHKRKDPRPWQWIPERAHGTDSRRELAQGVWRKVRV